MTVSAHCVCTLLNQANAMDLLHLVMLISGYDEMIIGNECYNESFSCLVHCLLYRLAIKFSN